MMNGVDNYFSQLPCDSLPLLARADMSLRGYVRVFSPPESRLGASSAALRAYGALARNAMACRKADTRHMSGIARFVLRCVSVF